jgi:hypothetical protein
MPGVIGGDPLSFKSREKRRRHKLANQLATAGARKNRTGETASRWFLTLARKPGKFACCGDHFDRGAEIIYRHEPREVRCLRCADRERVPYRPSIRWERANRKAAA